jgi:LPXTG-motif cell wall-anchored protein
MVGGLAVGSGIVVATEALVGASAGAAPTGDDTDIATTAPERVVTPTTHYPGPVATAERVVTPTTHYAGATTTTESAPAGDQIIAADATTSATPTTADATSNDGTSTTSTTAAPDDAAADVNAVGTGLAPVPEISGAAVVAQGGPVLPAAPPATSTGASSETLPTTGQTFDVPFVSGVGLALIGAALLRLRRRPSWD